MIDIENDVFDYVAKELRGAHSGLLVISDFVEAPAKFPVVTVIEADNRILQRMRTDNIENAVSVMYEVNIYSNKAVGKKSEAKEIANTTDRIFNDIGFTRTFRQQVPDVKDATIYRIVCRY
ncbi:MAG: hypothetical protein J6P40_02540, partial [Oscillospiraceae bacterium]|nr:hypothetical protein [Oscillospiraceae bacterium]